jgi:hypothetical protein
MPEDGTVRGAVVLCPPFGLEVEAAARAYQVLGEQLASQNFAVLHVDYDGTGDSAGCDEDPGRVEAWQSSVRAGVEFMRSSGALHVSVVGLRFGATVAASVAEECDLDALVLWDPCDGRSYLREEALLWDAYLGSDRLPRAYRGERASTGAPVEALGTVYGDETVRAMSGLSIASSQGPLARRVLALFRPGRSPRRGVLERLSMVHVEFGEAPEQEELLSVWSSKPMIPERTVGAIVEWLSLAAGLAAAPMQLPSPRVAAIQFPEGDEVVEEIMCLGLDRLFGVLTTPAVGVATTTVVLLNSGRIGHAGPGRLWVCPARSWARAGVSVLRVDLSGLGDSPTRPGQEPDLVFGLFALDDIAEITAAVSSRGSSGVVLMGLCSGARQSIDSALAVGARGIIAINPAFPEMSNPPGRWSSLSNRLGKRVFDVSNRVGGDSRRVSVLKRAVRRGLDVRWWLVNRARRERRPALVLKNLVEHGVDTFVICAIDEGRLITRGEGGALRSMRRTRRFWMGSLLNVDHSLYSKVARDQVFPVLAEHLASRYGAGAKRQGTGASPAHGPGRAPGP